MRDLRNELNIEAPRCRGGYLEAAPKEIWDNPDWAIEPKMDGNRITLQIGAEGSLLVGRNRQDFLKGVARAGEFRQQNEVNLGLASIACPELDLTVLDGELTECFCQDGTPEKGTLDREDAGIFTGYTAWQALVVKGKDVRNLPDWRRRELAGIIIDYLLEVKKVSYQKIRLIERLPATLENVNALLSQGIEGVVAKDITKPVPVGQRTNTWWWKVKGDKSRTVDAFVIGVSEAMEGGSGVRDIARKPNGKAATFTMAMMTPDGPVVVAKMFGIPDDAKETGFKHLDLWMNKVAEMQVSGWDGQRFRWPKFVKWRDDKGPNDCVLIEQLEQIKKRGKKGKK